MKRDLNIEDKFVEAAKEASIDRAKEKTPTYYNVGEEILVPSLGESIIRILSKSGVLKKEQLRKEAIEMSGKLYTKRFFDDVLNGYIEHNFVSYNKKSGYYSLRKFLKK